jgi:cyanate permease
LEHDDQKKELKAHIMSSLNGLKLDEQQSIGYTFKAMGAGFYGLRHSREKSFRDIILEIIMEAGDADR